MSIEPGPFASSPPAEPFRGRILVVDDEAEIRRLIERFLSEQGHHIRTASSVSEALEILGTEAFELVLTDLQMPGPSGLDLLAEVRVQDAATRMILMSGHAQVSDAAAAIDRGVDHLIIKPFHFDVLHARVTESLARYHAERTAAKERETLQAQLRQRDAESKMWVLRSAHALAAAVEAKDAYTAGHATRVTTYALRIAEVIGGIDLARFRLAGDLHDVGKIGVPDSVLNKPGHLTADEFEAIKKHPEIGERILQPMIDDEIVLGVVRWHHERWDGCGYPDARAGARIPLPARVLAVADTVDAMTSRRAYRLELSWETMVAEIRRCRGTQFDPRVVRAFDAALPRLQAEYNRFFNEPVTPPTS
jgi:putative two-component system response regulator